MDPTHTLDSPESSQHPTFETAAAHCTRQVPIAKATELVRDVREGLVGRRFDSASHLVVCSDDRFVGIVTIEDLLKAAADSTIASLMDQDAPFVAPGVDQEVAAWHAVRHSEAALAVVDENGRFTGLIPTHRLLAVLLAEHEEDLSRLGGFLRTTSAARTSSEESVRRRFWHRLPWLLLGLCGALLAADLVGRFEDVLRVNLILAFFMPGIVYLADAVGTQTETVRRSRLVAWRSDGPDGWTRNTHRCGHWLDAGPDCGAPGVVALEQLRSGRVRGCLSLCRVLDRYGRGNGTAVDT